MKAEGKARPWLSNVGGPWGQRHLHARHCHPGHRAGIALSCTEEKTDRFFREGGAQGAVRTPRPRQRPLGPALVRLPIAAFGTRRKPQEPLLQLGKESRTPSRPTQFIITIRRRRRPPRSHRSQHSDQKTPQNTNGTPSDKPHAHSCDPSNHTDSNPRHSTTHPTPRSTRSSQPQRITANQHNLGGSPDNPSHSIKDHLKHKNTHKQASKNEWENKHTTTQIHPHLPPPTTDRKSVV